MRVALAPSLQLEGAMLRSRRRATSYSEPRLLDDAAGGTSAGDEPTGILRVHLIAAEALMAGDVNGLSDPFVKLSIGHQEKKSRVIKSSLNPHWNEIIDFDVSLAVCASSGLSLRVYDWDRFKRSDELGSVAVSLAATTPVPQEFIEPLPQGGRLIFKISWLRPPPGYMAAEPPPAPPPALPSDADHEEARLRAQIEARQMLEAAAAREAALRERAEAAERALAAGGAAADAAAREAWGWQAEVAEARAARDEICASRDELASSLRALELSAAEERRRVAAEREALLSRLKVAEEAKAAAEAAAAAEREKLVAAARVR